jgi:hypothetical protein
MSNELSLSDFPQEIQKSFSNNDLEKSDGWKTINGAKVFMEGGKVKYGAESLKEHVNGKGSDSSGGSSKGGKSESNNGVGSYDMEEYSPSKLKQYSSKDKEALRGVEIKLPNSKENAYVALSKIKMHYGDNDHLYYVTGTMIGDTGQKFKTEKEAVEAFEDNVDSLKRSSDFRKDGVNRPKKEKIGERYDPKNYPKTLDNMPDHSFFAKDSAKNMSKRIKENGSATLSIDAKKDMMVFVMKEGDSVTAYRKTLQGDKYNTEEVDSFSSSSLEKKLESFYNSNKNMLSNKKDNWAEDNLSKEDYKKYRASKK